MTTARSAALDILGSVHEGEPLDRVLESAVLARLDSRDRGFARNLAFTTLRRRGQIDDALARCLERPLAAKHGTEHNVLRLGAAQLLFLGTKPHAAVDQTVELVGAGPHRGLINAVLRRLARESGAIIADQDAPRLCTPAWAWAQWSADWGEATAREIAKAHLAPPPLDLSVKTAAIDWAERLGGRVTPTGSVRIANAGKVDDLPGFAEGEWWIQDTAASLPARLLLGAIESPGGAHVADLCAAPGGKTAQLSLGAARVHAVDRSAQRLERLESNLARLHLGAEVITANAGDWRPPAPLQGVLLDAPCTATGTIRRHPDIPWRKDATNAQALIPIQDRLLASAAEMVATGGVLVYCVCALDRREGADRVAQFLAANPKFVRQPVRADEVGGLAALVNGEGDLCTLPSHLGDIGGMDGFYAARLRRAD